MSIPSTGKRSGAPASPPPDVPCETRIDAPHPVVEMPSQEVPCIEGNKAAADTPAADTPAADTPPAHTPAEANPPEPQGGPLPPEVERVAMQVRTQAAQLAEHLRARQRHLDHREAELNARAAQLERDARAARLWLNERMAELEERATTAPVEPDRQEEPLHRQGEVVAERSRPFDEAEAGLEAERNEVRTLRQQWAEERQRLEAETREERDRLSAEQQRVLAELEEKRRGIQSRSEQIDQSQAALEQLRQELGRIHRETLEIRLATEELWIQLSGAAPPAALIQSLGRIRTKLAEHYRLANAELQQQKEEITKLRDQLGEQGERLFRQKRQFDRWAAGCREEVEQQTARLLARAQELDGREAELREQERGRQEERLELQQEVRRLRARLSARAQAALPA